MTAHSLTRTPIRPANTSWEANALCRHPNADPTWWDHDGPKHPRGKLAVAWCRACPVRAACLADVEVFERAQKPTDLGGIRGGMSVRERNAIYRRKDAEDEARAATQDAGAAA